MPHQLFAAGLQAREIYPEMKKYFYKENSDVAWEDFLTTKFALWIDTRSSIMDSKKWYIASDRKSTFRLEDAMAHLSVTNPSSILMIEK